MNLTNLKKAADAVKAHDLAEHHAMHAEYTALAKERDAGTTPERAEEIRLRLNKLRALGRVSSATYRAKCNQVRAEVKALMDADPTTDQVERERLRESILISVREGKPEVDREAWRRKPAKTK